MPETAKKNKKKKQNEPDWTIEDNYAKYAKNVVNSPNEEPKKA